MSGIPFIERFGLWQGIRLEFGVWRLAFGVWSSHLTSHLSLLSPGPLTVGPNAAKKVASTARVSCAFLESASNRDCRAPSLFKSSVAETFPARAVTAIRYSIRSKNGLPYLTRKASPNHSIILRTRFPRAFTYLLSVKADRRSSRSSSHAPSVVCL